MTELSISSFSARGIKRKQNAVGKMLSKSHVLGICETLLRETDNGKRHWVSERININISHNQRRGFGGAGFVVHPVLRRKKIGAVATCKNLHLTIRGQYTNNTILYMAPTAREKGEEAEYQYISETHVSKSIAIADINASHRWRDTTTNERGSDAIYEH